MSTCSKCKVTLDTTNTYKKGKRLLSYCKVCFNRYCIDRWQKKKLRVVEQMGNKCHDCKNTYPPTVYDLHHIDPSQKEMGWDKMRLASEEKTQLELAKCVLLCANCHRIRHIAV
jgi:hypothetical protein